MASVPAAFQCESQKTCGEMSLVAAKLYMLNTSHFFAFHHTISTISCNRGWP